MSTDYLDWFAEIFVEAQVPLNEETAPWLDQALRRIAGAEEAEPEEVLAILRERYLKIGPPGRQLLAAYLRDEVFSRRDSPHRPRQGVGYFENKDYR
jgi:hypothetical protein